MDIAACEYCKSLFDIPNLKCDLTGETIQTTTYLVGCQNFAWNGMPVNRRLLEKMPRQSRLLQIEIEKTDESYWEVVGKGRGSGSYFCRKNYENRGLSQS